MVSRLAAFVIWAAVAASIVFWALRLGSEPMTVPAHATVVATNSGFNGNLERVLGTDVVAAAAPAAVTMAPADPRFKLIGVVAPRSAAARAEGLALIALDNKPARAYRVGAVVDGDMVLQTVHSRGATLGPRGQAAQVDLALPALPPPATGVPGMGGALPPHPLTGTRVQPDRALPAAPIPRQSQSPSQSEAEQDEPPRTTPNHSATPLEQDEPPGITPNHSATPLPMERPPTVPGRARPL